MGWPKGVPPFFLGALSVGRWVIDVFWWFERQGTFLRCEAQIEPDGGYQLIFTDADGSEHIERFKDSSDLEKGQLDLERRVRAEGWTGPHGRYE